LEAETLAFGYSQILSNAFQKTGIDWLDRFCVFARLGSLVIRVQTMTCSDYVSHLAALKDWSGDTLEANSKDDLEKSLPESFWMAELSAPELFSATRHKFGEFLIAADRPFSNDLLSLLLAARLPGCAVLRDRGGQLRPEPTRVKGHTQLFTRPAP
jgi:hypothetical protein